MTQLFSNAARAELAASINGTDPSFTITAGGSLFPVANTGSAAIGPGADWFKLTIQDDDGYEIVFVRTHASGSNTFSNVLRGQENTVARDFLPSAVVGLRPTAGDSDAFNAKEPAIAAGTADQYYRGNKTWQDFATSVRASVLTGLSTATNAVVTATDSVVAAIGKLQKQVTDNLAAHTDHASDSENPHAVTKAQVGLTSVDDVSAADLRDRQTHTGTQDAATITGLHAVATSGEYAALDGVPSAATTSQAGLMSGADKAKLDEVAAQATKNDTDANLKARANHTGTQEAATITGLAAVATSNDYLDLDNRPGVATTESDGLMSAADKTFVKTLASPTSGPTNLLIYYGYPIAYQGLWNVDAVVAAISSQYDVWVVGDQYEIPSHEVYADTAAIIQGVQAQGVQVWGYVSTGVNTSNRSLATIEGNINDWDALGVDGIFLDEFGFDYENTRQRQIDIVNLVYAKGLPYSANAWVWQDVACDSASELPAEWAVDDWRRVAYATGNPTSLPLPRSSNDVYVVENFGISNLGPANQFDLHQRMKTINATNHDEMTIWAIGVLPENPVGTLDLTLAAPFASVDEVSRYLWAAAYVHDLDSLGINGFSFGAAGGTASFVVPRLQLPSYVTNNSTAAVTITSDMIEATRIMRGGELSVTTDSSNGVYKFTLPAPATLAEAPATLPTVAHTAASYTLALTDAGKRVAMNNAAANGVTVPPDSDVSFANGTLIFVSQEGAGATSILAGVGVTIDTAEGLNIGQQYRMVGLSKIGANHWTLFGGVL